MKLIKSLLLGTAAGFAAVAGAQAADLPTKKAAPVEYVRVCSQFGAGFWYVPGSDTCIKLSGRIRADYFYNEPYTRQSNTTSTRARAYIGLDSYTATDYGPVRATLRTYVTKDSGGNSSGATTTSIDWAYIQFAGLTAGRVATSFFEFAPFGGVSLLGGGSNGRGSDYGAINALAYTFNAGNGFLATLALEDATERRVGIFSTSAAIANGVVGYAGHLMPDVVGRLDWTQPWGQVMLAGAVHQVRSAQIGAIVPDTEYGFAIQGGVKVNLPMLAAGDALFLQGAYADGASSYTGWSSISATNVSGVNGSTYDAYVNALGDVKKVQSYSLVGGVEHYWAPTFSTALFGSYGNYNGATLTIVNTTASYDYTAYGVGANMKWTPVKGLLFAAEAVYQKLTDVPNVARQAALAVGNYKDSAWSGRLRVQRDF